MNDAIIPFDLHYNFPEGSYISLLLIPIFLALWMLLHFRQSQASLFSAALLTTRSTKIFYFKMMLRGSCWIFATIALMQPLGNGYYAETQMQHQDVQLTLKRKAHDIIFLIDTSASMNITDTRTGATRLEYAKEIANEMISEMSGESAALYTFTSQVSQLSPITLDTFFVRLMLRSIAINEGGTAGTNFVEAIANMRKKYFSQASPKLKTLIILSDGGDTTIESLEGSARTKAIDALADLVARREKTNLRVFTIGMGSTQGGIVPDVTDNNRPVISKLDEELLKHLAVKGRGVYYNGNAYTTLEIVNDIYAQLKQDPIFYSEEEGIAPPFLKTILGDAPLLYSHYFQFPLAISLLALCACLLLPDSLLWKGSR